MFVEGEEDSRLKRHRKQVNVYIRSLGTYIQMDQMFCVNCGATGPVAFPDTPFVLWQCTPCAEKGFHLPGVHLTAQEEDAISLKLEELA